MRRFARRARPVMLVCALVLAGPAVRAEDDDEKLVRLTVEVKSADEEEEAIPKASVYVKFKEDGFLWMDDEKQWSVKTNEKGKAVFPVPLPEGRILLQVVAEGWKTFGKYYKIKGPQKTIEVKLKKPKRWY